MGVVAGADVSSPSAALPDSAAGADDSGPSAASPSYARPVDILELDLPSFTPVGITAGAQFKLAI